MASRRYYIDDFMPSAGIDEVGRIEGKVARELDGVDVSAAAVVRRRRRRGSLCGRRRPRVRRVPRRRGRVAAARRGRLGVGVAGGRRGFDGLRRRRRLGRRAARSRVRKAFFRLTVRQRG